MPIPMWAQNIVDVRKELPTDGTQTVVPVAIQNCLCLAVTDTAAYKMVMNLKMAQHLGLPVRLAKKGDCRQYGVSGSGLQHD